MTDLLGAALLTIVGAAFLVVGLTILARPTSGDNADVEVSPNPVVAQFEISNAHLSALDASTARFASLPTIAGVPIR